MLLTCTALVTKMLLLTFPCLLTGQTMKGHRQRDLAKTTEAIRWEVWVSSQTFSLLVDCIFCTITITFCVQVKIYKILKVHFQKRMVCQSTCAEPGQGLLRKTLSPLELRWCLFLQYRSNLRVERGKFIISIVYIMFSSFFFLLQFSLIP